MGRMQRIAAFALIGAVLAVLCVALLFTFGRQAPSTNGDYVGVDPPLPEPDKSLLPTINFSQAAPWPTGKQPVAPKGFKVTPYASGLDHPRWLYVLPNG